MAASLRGTKHDFRLYDDVVDDDEGAARALCTMVAGSIPCHATVASAGGALICWAEAKASLAPRRRRRAAPSEATETSMNHLSFFKNMFNNIKCDIFNN